MLRASTSRLSQVIVIVALSVILMGMPATAKSTPLTFWVIESFTPTKDAAIYKAVAEFNKANPDIEVRVEPIPAASLREKYVNAVFGGGGPDIAALDTAWMAEFAQMGLVKDISGKFSTVRGRFFEGPVETAEYRGKYYAVPWYTNNVALFYNKDALASVGYAKPPATWSEFRSMAEALKKKNMYALAFAHDDFAIFMWLPFLYQAGADLVNKELNGPGFDNAEGREAWNLITDMYAKGYMPESIKSVNSWSEVYAPFIQGKAAFVITGDWGIMPIANAKPGFEWSIAPLPAHRKAATVIGGYNLAMSKNCRDVDAAWRFFDYLTKPENLWILQSYNRIPAVAAVLETEYATSDPLMSVFFQQSKVGVARPRVPEYETIMVTLGEAFDTVIFGVSTPEAALKKAAAEVKNILK